MGSFTFQNCGQSDNLDAVFSSEGCFVLAGNIRFLVAAPPDRALDCIPHSLLPPVCYRLLCRSGNYSSAHPMMPSVSSFMASPGVDWEVRDTLWLSQAKNSWNFNP